MNPRHLSMLLFLVLLAACAPELPASPTIPSTPAGPCTDRGWKDITAGLKQFDSTAKLRSYPSLLQYLNDLQAARDAVAAVEVDPCYRVQSELIIQAVDAELYGYRILVTRDWCGEPVPDELQSRLVCQTVEVAWSNIDDGTNLLWDAHDQLTEMGIDLGFPLFGRP